MKGMKHMKAIPFMDNRFTLIQELKPGKNLFNHGWRG